MPGSSSWMSYAPQGVKEFDDDDDDDDDDHILHVSRISVKQSLWRSAFTLPVA